MDRNEKEINKKIQFSYREVLHLIPTCFICDNTEVLSFKVSAHVCVSTTIVLSTSTSIRQRTSVGRLWDELGRIYL